jgi:hypothetical protein
VSFWQVGAGWGQLRPSLWSGSRSLWCRAGCGGSWVRVRGQALRGASRRGGLVIAEAGRPGVRLAVGAR